MTNFGLTFRNSKWSDYAIKNVTMSSLTSFTRLIRNIFMLIVLLSFTLSYVYYYNYNITYNNLTYVIWSFFEDVNYLVTYSFWSLTFVVSLVIQYVYNKIFFVLYDVKKSDLANNANASDVMTRMYKPSKDLRSSILMSFLTTSDNAKHNPTLIENLFRSENPLTSWNTFAKTFKTLYTSNFLLNNVSESKNITNLQLFNSSSDITFSSFSRFHTYSLLSTDENVMSVNSLHSPSKSTWNLYSFSHEINKYNHFLVGKKNLFYLNQFNFQSLTNLTTNIPELSFLTQSVMDQTKVVKWNRWLYRYNVLHRKTVKNSHKLTMVKKLISTGFYDSSLMSNNLWASNFFSKTSKTALDTNTLDMLRSQFNLLYKDVLTNKYGTNAYTSTLTLNSPSSPLNMLRHFEKSYFWFVKRFYMYNTLNTNTITSNVILTQKNDVDSNDNLANTYTQYALLLNTLTKSPNLTNGILNPTYSTTVLNHSTKSHVINSTKDITLLINEWDILNSDNLEILNNFNNAITNNHSDLTFFNINDYTYNTPSTGLVFNFKGTISKPNLITTTAFLQCDQRLLSDISLLTGLMK